MSPLNKNKTFTLPLRELKQYSLYPHVTRKAPGIQKIKSISTLNRNNICPA